jgi:hypothetical protein
MAVKGRSAMVVRGMLIRSTAKSAKAIAAEIAKKGRGGREEELERRMLTGLYFHPKFSTEGSVPRHKLH